MKKGLVISIMANVLLVVILLLLVVRNGLQIERASKNSEWSYMDNPLYSPAVSMFELVEGDADIVFAGDSITAYGRFSEFFPEKVVLNRGIGSDTAEGLLNRLDEIISHHPQKVFIMVGINDIVLNVSEEDYIEDYASIISLIKSADCKVYILSILPCVNGNLDLICKRNESLQNLCMDNGIEYVNLYDSFFANGKVNTNLFAEDGIHLNGEGYKIWIDNVRDMVYED